MQANETCWSRSRSEGLRLTAPRNTFVMLMILGLGSCHSSVILHSRKVPPRLPYALLSPATFQLGSSKRGCWHELGRSTKTLNAELYARLTRRQPPFRFSPHGSSLG